MGALSCTDLFDEQQGRSSDVLLCVAHVQWWLFYGVDLQGNNTGYGNQAVLFCCAASMRIQGKPRAAQPFTLRASSCLVMWRVIVTPRLALGWYGHRLLMVFGVPQMKNGKHFELCSVLRKTLAAIGGACETTL